MNALGKIIFTIAVLLYGGQINAEGSSDLYFVDAHSQIDHKVGGVDVVLKRMSDNNVTTTLLSARGKISWREIIDWSSEYPTRILPLIRSKGKHYQNNTPKYYKEVRKQIKAGKFVGAAEILVFHAQKGNKAPKVAVDFNDERVSLLVTESLSRNWPVVIHIEFASLNGRERQGYLEGMSSLLEKHPKHPFVLIHMGQLQHQQVQELIEHHPNLYLLTSHTDPVTVNNSKQPWVNIFSLDGQHFKEHWKNLFIAYPDRFIFALDNVWDHHWQESYDKKMKCWRTALSELPENSAHLIAHGNAERLWKLK